MISVVCYLWKGERQFLPAYVNVLARMVATYLPEPHRFICVTDGELAGFSSAVEVVALPPETAGLTSIKTPEGDKFPSSYRRLWTFADSARVLGERILLLDIDCIIVGDMRPLFLVQSDFVGWRVRSPPGGPPRFGGGTWLLQTGTRTHVWEQFVADPELAIATARARGYRGSDQAWISYCLADSEAAWAEPSGIYCAQDYRKAWARANNVRARQRERDTLRMQRRRPGWKYPKPPPPYISTCLQVPPGAIILHMNGSDKPWTSSDAITTKYWRPYMDRPAAASASC